MTRADHTARWAGLVTLLCVGCGPAGPPDHVLMLATRAERTGFQQSTGYGEITRQLQYAAAASDLVHLTTFGSTVDGRPIPLVVVGDLPDARPASVRASPRLRVWLQGAIHGGEVCGKEALLMLLRSLVVGDHPEWASSMTLLIAPIYNADGNERIGPENRPYQLGPYEGAGERANTQGLDLNRDHMKLESPEARALTLAYQDYDPHVVIDLHTTNGTEHAYHLTYAPPLHPNTHPDIDALLRDEWLPTVTTEIKRRDGQDFYYYGNVPRGTNVEPRWQTFDHRPRFNNNYAGLRNRVGILSEAYAYASFEERVRSTLRFVEETLQFAHERADTITALVDRVDDASVVGMRMTTRAAAQRSETPVQILLGATEEVQNPFTRATMKRRLDVAEPTTMYEYGTFSATDEETAPAAYYIPADLTAVIDLLAAHGVDGGATDAPTTITAEQFTITASSQDERLFEGHLQRTVDGAWEPVEQEVPAGTLVVPVDQPLGRLLFSLLEPRSDDGVVNWNLLDDQVRVGAVYPILRVTEPPSSPEQ
ncbi:MAG: M14 family metallopeptidase [bacterium]